MFNFNNGHLQDKFSSDINWTTFKQTRVNAELVSLAMALNGDNWIVFLRIEKSKKIEVTYMTIENTFIMHYPIEERNLKSSTWKRWSFQKIMTNVQGSNKYLEGFISEWFHNHSEKREWLFFGWWRLLWSNCLHSKKCVVECICNTWASTYKNWWCTLFLGGCIIIFSSH